MIWKNMTLGALVALFVAAAHAAEQECGQQELTKCARPLQVLSDTSDLSFVSNKEELDLLCPDLFTGLRCIHSYTKRCMSPEQRGHFGRLYRGTGAAVRDLCTEGDYQTRFLKHAPCLKGLKSQYESCASAYQSAVGALAQNTTKNQQSNDKLKMLCCSFQAYMGCSEEAVRSECGDDSAAFTREFLHRMGDTLIKMHCGQYPEDSEQCAGFMDHRNLALELAPGLLALALPALALTLRRFLC